MGVGNGGGDHCWCLLQRGGRLLEDGGGWNGRWE